MPGKRPTDLLLDELGRQTDYQQDFTDQTGQRQRRPGYARTQCAKRQPGQSGENRCVAQNP